MYIYVVVFDFLGYAFPDSPNNILVTESIKQNEKQILEQLQNKSHEQKA